MDSKEKDMRYVWKIEYTIFDKSNPVDEVFCNEINFNEAVNRKYSNKDFIVITGYEFAKHICNKNGVKLNMVNGIDIVNKTIACEPFGWFVTGMNNYYAKIQNQ